MQVKQLLEQRYPSMQVVGSNYPPTALKQAAAQAVGTLQLGGFALVIVGDKIFETLGVPQPLWYSQNVAQNRFGTAVGVWFVGNFIQNQLISTGAFEVYYDGSLVFSKLAAGRMPSADELLGSLDAQMTARMKEDDATSPVAAEL